MPLPAGPDRDRAHSVLLIGPMPFLLDERTVIQYTPTMRIRSARHRGLKRLIEDDDEREIRRDLVSRVRRILTALQSSQGIEGVRGPPGWHLHQLVGNRAGTWSISVSGNWRITFEVIDDEIHHLDLEDYH
jgi:proteic killer suppression protein